MSPPRASSPPRSRVGPFAFTLVELLAVMSVIVVLMALLVPSVIGLFKTKGLGSASNIVSEMIDVARTEAMAKNTYVWLGFNNRTVNGSDQLLVVAARSLDGSPTVTSSNLRVIGKAQKLDDIRLTDSAGLTSKVQSMLSAASVTGSNAPAVSTTSVNPGLTATVGGSAVSFVNLITFTAQGEAILTATPSSATPPAPFTTQMLLGLRQTTGGTPVASATESVALVLYGGTGQIRVFRP